MKPVQRKDSWTVIVNFPVNSGMLKNVQYVLSRNCLETIGG